MRDLLTLSVSNLNEPALSANERQAGKTLPQRLVRAIYGETAYQIARRDGEVSAAWTSHSAQHSFQVSLSRASSDRCDRFATHAREN